MYSNKMNEMNTDHQQSLKKYEEECQRKIRELKKEMVNLTGEKEELELQINL